MEPATRDNNKLINEAIKRILLDIVVRGHGDRLIGRWSREPEIQHFLEEVPYMLDRINQLHLACTRVESQEETSQHLHHYHHRHKDTLPLGRTSLNDLINLIGQDRHWLVRTRDSLGLTPLHKAVLFHNRPIVEYILDRYPDELAASGWSLRPSNKMSPQPVSSGPLQQPPGIRLIDAQDKYGRTALHYAAALCSGSNREPNQVALHQAYLYHFLIAKGASTSIRDFRGKTPAQYARHPSHLKAKSVIHLANKLNANYQANILSKTLRATTSKQPTVSIRDCNHSPIRLETVELANESLASNRESMSVSCNDLSTSSREALPLNRNKRNSSLLVNLDQCENIGLYTERPPGDASRNQEVNIDNLKRVENRLEMQTSQLNNGESDRLTPPQSSLSLCSDQHECQLWSDLELAHKQLLTDRCQRQVLDQRTKLYVRRCLNEGTLDKVNQLLVDGHGSYIMSEVNVCCWNQQCKRYINNVIPNLMQNVDRLHESIALNQLERVRTMLNSDPIIARIKRPYKRAAMSALHVAVHLDRKTIVKYLVCSFPELIAQRDSHGATCLHWAARSLQHERLFCWLSELYGHQLEHIRDSRGRFASDYRQQAIRLSGFGPSHPIDPERACNVRDILQQNQEASNKLVLTGTKISLRSRRRKKPIPYRTTTKITEPSLKSKLKEEIDSSGEEGNQPNLQWEDGSAPQTALVHDTEQPLGKSHVCTDGSSSLIEFETRDVVAMQDKSISDMQAQRITPERNEQKTIDTEQNQVVQLQLDCLESLNEMVKVDLTEPSSTHSIAAEEAISTEADTETGRDLESPMRLVADPNLLQRPAKLRSASRRLDSAILQHIRCENVRELEHFILAGCGRRVLSVFRDHCDSEPAIGVKMRHFLDSQTPIYMDTISRAHTVLHQCYSHSMRFDPNMMFHKLCNLIVDRKLILGRDTYGACLLHIAAIRSDKRVVEYLLRRHPEAGSAPDHDSRNVLHYAAMVLSVYSYHGAFKLTRLDAHDTSSNPPGWWIVDQNSKVMYDNLCNRYEELANVKDKKGHICRDYLREQDSSLHVALSEQTPGLVSVQVLESCCPDYAQLLARYNYVILNEPIDLPMINTAPEVGPHLPVGLPTLLDHKLSQMKRADSETMTSSFKKDAQRDERVKTRRARTSDDLLKHSNYEPVLSPTNQVSDQTLYVVKQMAPRLAVGSEVGFWPMYRDSYSSENKLRTDPTCRKQLYHSAPGHRHHRASPLFDLNLNHNSRQGRKASRRSADARLQSVVGGVIVPTIIHDDRMDQVEGYDIIYRQPPPPSLQLDCNSDEHGKRAISSFLDELESIRNSSCSSTSGSDSGDETSDSCSNDEQERVKRLSLEFENRVTKEKNELKAKVDEIMREIKQSAKTGKSSTMGLVSSSGPSKSCKDMDLELTHANRLSDIKVPSSLCSSGHSSTCTSTSSASSVISNSSQASSKYQQEYRTVSSSSSSYVCSSCSAHSRKFSAARASPERETNMTIAQISSIARHVVNKNTFGQTYLHFIASRSQNGSTFYKILEHGGHLIGERDVFYRTARDVAVQFNIPSNVQTLDKFIIDLFIANKKNLLRHLLNQGYSPLIHVSDCDGNDIMLILKLLKLNDMIHFLLQMADFQRWRDELHTFIRHGYSAGVSELIGKHKDLVRAKSVHARTSLHLAVLFNRLDMVVELLERDTYSVNATDNMGRTALHYIYGLESSGGSKIREKLVASGADPELRDAKMRTPKYYYIFKREIEEIKRIELELG